MNFKDIPGFEGLYQASDCGQVKSLERLDKLGRFVKEKILKLFKNRNGYYYLHLIKDGNKKSMRVHVLVAMAFLGHIPDGHTIVPDHKDTDKSNNNLSNIELITQRENIERYWSTKKTSSKYIGVCWEKNANKWVTFIYINGKRKHLGYFNTELEAHLAYQKALEMYNNGDLSFMESKKSSQYKGVHWNKKANKWQAYIKIEGKQKHLGLFETEPEAHLAYQKAFNELNK